MKQPDHFADVAKFNDACGVYRVAKFGDPLPLDVLAMRRALVIEEYNELLYAISHNDRVGIADACADLAYVALGWLWAIRFTNDVEWNITPSNRYSIEDRLRHLEAIYNCAMYDDDVFDIVWMAKRALILGNAYGFPMDDVWNEVQRSNMAKINSDGTVTRRADGKILKPAGWTPPDIAGVLERTKNG